MPSNVNRKSLPERTADAIAYMLHSENYATGQKLPNELQMAELFEVSRSTIRKAEAILAERGLLVIERGSGTYVSKTLGADSDPLGLSIIYDRDRLTRELLELRLMIEPTCASLAAQNATDADIALMRRLCDEMETDILSGRNYLQKDMEFHQAVANSCGNSVMHSLIPYIHRMLILHDSKPRVLHREETLHEHRVILDAIEKKRGKDAYDAMQWHLMVIYGRLQGEKTSST